MTIIDTISDTVADIMQKLAPDNTRFVAVLYEVVENQQLIVAAHGPFDTWGACMEWCEVHPGSHVVPLFEIS